MVIRPAPRVRFENKIDSGAVVEYEQHGKPLLGVVVGEKRSKWIIVNERGQELELTSDRLYLVPGRPMAGPDRGKFLQSFADDALSLAASLPLEEVWEVLKDERREISEAEICEILFPSASPLQHLAVRRALLADTVYFKRRKTGFEPRPIETIAELKKQNEIEERKRADRAALSEALVRRLRGEHETVLPENVAQLEQLAAFGGQAEGAKEMALLVDEVAETGGLKLTGKPDERATKLLISAGHFDVDVDLNLFRARRGQHFPAAVENEVETLTRSMVWKDRELLDLPLIITVDSPSTRDIDDALSLERTSAGYRLGIHISDAASLIAPDSALERESFLRGTSVYCADYQVPMLPTTLSEGLLSLWDGTERPVVSFFIDLSEDGNLLGREIRRTLIRVTRRMSYEEVDRLLQAESAPMADRSVWDLVTKLWDISCRFERNRISSGATQYTRREMIPRIREDKRIVLEETDEETPARRLVSELMIAANETAAHIAQERGVPLIFRSQEPPDVELESQGLDIREGPARDYFVRGFLKRSIADTKPRPHFGLGLPAYVHMTSPIRRAVDLVNQRQLMSFLSSGRFVYEERRLLELISLLEAALDEASQLQRSRTRYWLYRYLVQENIRELSGTIIRIDTQKPLAEVNVLCTIQSFVPARPVGQVTDRANSRLGERVRLRIDQIDPRREILSLTEIAEG